MPCTTSFLLYGKDKHPYVLPYPIHVSEMLPHIRFVRSSVITDKFLNIVQMRLACNAFEVFRTVTVQVVAFWVVTLCSLVIGYHQFEASLPISWLK
jgi:hypothetical protein